MGLLKFKFTEMKLNWKCSHSAAWAVFQMLHAPWGWRIPYWIQHRHRASSSLPKILLDHANLAHVPSKNTSHLPSTDRNERRISSESYWQKAHSAQSFMNKSLPLPLKSGPNPIPSKSWNFTKIRYNIPWIYTFICDILYFGHEVENILFSTIPEMLLEW